VARDLERSAQGRDTVFHVGEPEAHANIPTDRHAAALVGNFQPEVVALPPDAHLNSLRGTVLLCVDNRLERHEIQRGLRFAAETSADDIRSNVQFDRQRQPLCVRPERCRQPFI